MSGLFALAKPRRIKASHRRRRKVASGQSVQRYYDPQIGRFLSVDPVTAQGGDQRYFNRYWYAGGNPYKYTDPDGRVLDTLADIGFIAYSGYKLATEPSWTNAAALGADVVGAAIPFATGLGAGVRAAAHADELADTAKVAANKLAHKNSLDHVGDTHVYAIRNPDGTVNKIGESAQGTRLRDGASKRAEQQVRKLNRDVGPGHKSEIRKTFPNKREAREYETKLIERYRRRYGDDTLPGNKTNR